MFTDAAAQAARSAADGDIAHGPGTTGPQGEAEAEAATGALGTASLLRGTVVRGSGLPTSPARRLMRHRHPRRWYNLPVLLGPAHVRALRTKMPKIFDAAVVVLKDKSTV